MSSAIVLAGTAGFDTITSGKSISPETGAMSCSRLNGSWSNSVTLTAADAGTNSSVYPSGGELTTAWIEMLLLAPGLFSITTGWPSRSDNHGAMILGTMSAPPPGGEP